jgi:drug/metabolite transporter (DMT)-like permease
MTSKGDFVQKNVIQGHLAAFTSHTIFGLSIAMTKALLPDWMTPLGYNISRMLFGLAFFWCISFFQPKEKIPFKDLLFIFLGGFLGTTIPNPAFAVAMNYTSPAIWSIMMAASPIMVLVLSVLILKEKAGINKIAGIILGIAGAVIIVSESVQGSFGQGNAIGIGIAVLTIFCLSFSMLIQRKLSVKYSPVTLMKFALLLSVIIIGPFSVPELSRQRIYSAETQMLPLLMLSFCLVFASGIAFFLGPYALKRINASTASFYISAQPLTACTASIVSGQDSFSFYKLAAFILVTAGILLVSQSAKELPENINLQGVNNDI